MNLLQRARRRTLKLVDGGGEKTSHVVADINDTLLSFSDVFGGGTLDADGLAGFSAFAAACALPTVSCHFLSVAAATIASICLRLDAFSRYSSLLAV